MALMLAQMRKNMGVGQQQQAQGVSAAGDKGANRFANAHSVQRQAGPQAQAGLKAGQSKAASGGGDQLAQFKQQTLPNTNPHRPTPNQGVGGRVNFSA
ncbi:MAG TPA: hypothetical protein V6C52_02105 [Coleofasciculaceae cyanobacterium]|jgi:hypothetical protein